MYKTISVAERRSYVLSLKKLEKEAPMFLEQEI